MAVSIDVRFEQDSPIAEVFNRLMGGDMRSMYNEIGAALQTSTQLRFNQQQTPDGNPWKQSWRANMQGGQTGRDTSRLFNSITYNASGAGVEVGTDVEYGEYFHFGADIKPVNAPYLVFQVMGQWRKTKQVNIPARPWLGLDQNDEAEILAIVSEHFDG